MNKVQLNILKGEWLNLSNKNISLEQFIRQKNSLYQMSMLHKLRDGFFELYAQGQIKTVPLDLNNLLINYKELHQNSNIINHWNKVGTASLTIGEFNTEYLKRNFTNDRVRSVLTEAVKTHKVSIIPKDISLNQSFIAIAIHKYFSRKAKKFVKRHNIGFKLKAILGIVAFDIAILPFVPEEYKNTAFFCTFSIVNLVVIVLIWWNYSSD